MQITQPLGYRMCIAADSLINIDPADSSLRTWIMTAPNPLTDTWKTRVDDKVIGIRDKFGSRALHSYFVMHENDLRGGSGPPNDTSTWTAFGYVVDRIKSLDSAHKSYVVYNTHSDFGIFPFGITLAQFASRFPKLGIFQVDDYTFQSGTGADTAYTYQQRRLDTILVNSYNLCMTAFRNGSTEWHAVIQSQRDESITPGSGFRRPTLYEVRVQAYLALSRGSKGITAYVYGSGSSGGHWSATYQPLMLVGGRITSSPAAQVYLKGLVDYSRNPVDPSNYSFDPVPGYTNLQTVYNEIKQIGSTVRKLRVYDAFPHWAIPTDNIAHIVQSSVTSDYDSSVIEFGTFKRVDQGSDSSIYFMVVNRVCNNSDGSVSPTQTITFKVNGSSIDGPYYLQDQRTKSNILYTAYYPGNKYSKFTITLQPGEGKLFWLYPYAAPPAPTGLTYELGAGSNPVLSWTASTALDVVRYDIYRSLEGGDYNLIGSSETTNYTDHDLSVTEENNYMAIYYIQAVDAVSLVSQPSTHLHVWYNSLLKKATPVAEIPHEYNLAQNYPNPFNPSTTISYALPEAGMVHLTVFDYLGRGVATLVDEYKEPGYYQANFNASRLSSGIYFCKIQAGKFKAIKKMLLMK